MHLVVVGHAFVDRSLYVARQVGDHVGSDWLRRRRLERLAREHALKPRHPLLEYLPWRVLPVEHAVFERGAHLVAVRSQDRFCKREYQSPVTHQRTCSAIH